MIPLWACGIKQCMCFMQHEGNVDMFRANETFPHVVLLVPLLRPPSGLALLPAGSPEERGRVIGLYRWESFTRWKDLVLFHSVSSEGCQAGT